MDKRKNCVFGKGFASVQALGACLFRACWPRAQRWPDFSEPEGKENNFWIHIQLFTRRAQETGPKSMVHEDSILGLEVSLKNVFF